MHAIARGQSRAWLFKAALIALAASLSLGTGWAADRGDTVEVIVETSHGRFVMELYPELAPRTVERFLARAEAEEGEGLVPYAGLQVCESRPHGHLILGCSSPEHPALDPRAPQAEPRLPDEIDAVEMGLDQRVLKDPARVEWLWQQEVFPRHRELQAAGEPVPAGLRRLVQAIERRGERARSMLKGKSWLWYLRAIGYEFDPDGSPLRFTRGAVATASYWPNEADARFLIALTRIPERDGRATVFGQIVSGWEGIERILEVPLDKSNRPRQAISIRSIRRR